MKGLTISEKILASHAEGGRARAGEIVVGRIDMAMATDGSAPMAIDFFNQMGGRKTFNPERIMMVIDHYVPCPNDKVSRLHDVMREFAGKNMCRLLNGGEGICHSVLPEKRCIRPGEIVIGADSHSTTYGAFNALGIGVGSSDLASAMISGKLWFKVPETIRVTLHGSLRPNVSAKDAALTIVGRLRANGGDYKALEFAGGGVGNLDMVQRMTICNMMAETGVKCALMPFDDATRTFFATDSVEGVFADPDAVYVQEMEFDLSSVEPMAAKPHSVDNVVPLKELCGMPVHMGVIGTCTGGHMEDLRAALDQMGDLPLAPGFELLVVPASRAIYVEGASNGIFARFAEKGALILPPGCGPCCGSSPGTPEDGENVLSSANRNFKGRMGNVKANIYLASPAAVGAASVAGRVVEPRVI